MIKGHPTKYKGIQFRSRLEARWAAFFDLIGWKWAYEPIELQGWIPDFILGPDLNTGVMVEVKPIDWSADEYVPLFSRERGPRRPTLLTEELDAARRALPPGSRGLLLCGLRPYEDHSFTKQFGYHPFTWTPGIFWDAEQQMWGARWVHEDDMTQELDVPLGNDPYIGMATGRSFKDTSGYPGTERMTRAWTEAGNITQYKRP